MNRGVLIFLLSLLHFFSFAHPMPNSVVSLSVMEYSIAGEAKMSLLDLEAALKMELSDTLNVNTPFFMDYFRQHIKAYSGKELWTTSVDSLRITTDMDINVGKYQEVLIWFTMTPPEGKSLRSFLFNYDVIIHQVITHKILVYLKSDWKNGIHSEDLSKPLGTIYTNFMIGAGEYQPLKVSLEDGSWWKGFKDILNLGMQHIKEGTDHLLFLIVLLLPATLLKNGRQWGKYGGLNYSVSRLLKIVTAFTIGHSITLLIGALGWVHLPTQPVEILIAISILVSAVHAIYPIFPGKEMYVAAGFGLIHGLAFAGVLYGMNLSAGTLAVSILGFNIGIEGMQLFIIALIIPWLVLLSHTSIYKWVRITGAILAAIAALAWVVERSSGKGNFITGFVERGAQYSLWIIVLLAFFSIIVYKRRVLSSKF